MTVSSISTRNGRRSQDRRSHPRISTPQISAAPLHGELDIVNLSRRGMSVRSLHPLTVGGTYLFELWQEGNSLVVEGEVRWSRSRLLERREQAHDRSRYQAGVAFERVRSREQRQPWPTAVESTPEHRRPVDRLAAARVALAEAESIHVAAEALLDSLEPAFERLVLLRCHPSAVRPWMGRGRTIRPFKLQGLELSFAQPSLFLHLREGGSYFRGILPAMPLHQDLIGCWNGSLEQVCGLIPIRIGNRLVTVLYADTGGEELSNEDFDLLRRAGRLMQETMSRLILQQKNRSRHPGSAKHGPDS